MKKRSTMSGRKFILNFFIMGIDLMFYILAGMMGAVLLCLVCVVYMMTRVLRDITNKFLQVAVVQRAETYQDAREAATLNIDAEQKRAHAEIDEEIDLMAQEYEETLNLKKQLAEDPNDVWEAGI